MFVFPGLGSSCGLSNNYLINPQNGQHSIAGELDCPLLGLEVIVDADLVAVLDFAFLGEVRLEILW